VVRISVAASKESESTSFRTDLYRASHKKKAFIPSSKSIALWARLSSVSLGLDTQRRWVRVLTCIGFKEECRMALERAVAMPNSEKRDSAPASRLEFIDCADSLSEMGNPQWFALAVKPRYDKAVCRTLEDKGFETLLPLYKKQHSYAARFKESELPLFPGYVFCRFNVLTRMPILTTPGVTQILGTGNRPIPLSGTEIGSLRTVIKAELPLQPFSFLQVGQRVRIEQGVLKDVVGIIIRFKQSFRLVLSVTLLQRSVVLEIDQYLVSLERELQRASGENGQQSLSPFLPSSKQAV